MVQTDRQTTDDNITRRGKDEFDAQMTVHHDVFL